MIRNLKIRNYALIEELDITFVPGFITITGETGAGKSILMGALSLILGNRADTLVLKNREKKCIVEGEFAVDEKIKGFFIRNDLDYDQDTLIRREILPGGKSRAFINDTPVNLHVLRQLGEQLVDIHSQHQNLQLNDHLYQLEVVDYIGENMKAAAEYREVFNSYSIMRKRLEKLKSDYSGMRGDLDYMQFQYNELKNAGLKADEQAALDEEAAQLEHAEEIKLALHGAFEALSAEGQALERVRDAHMEIRKISGFFGPAADLEQRLDSLQIELKDISAEIQISSERIEHNPERLQEVRERLDLFYSLMQKHRVNDLAGLIAIREELDERIGELDISDEKILEMEGEAESLLSRVHELADELHATRVKAGEYIEKEVVSQLRQLRMPNATFRVEIRKTDHPDQNGMDEVRFLFSANKNSSLEEISRVASGGEISRLMLCIKSLLSAYKGLPTLIFDEIDSGVSGDIAEKVGGIMKRMSGGRQVIAITHLPQVASQGIEHFMVYKEDKDDTTVTRIRQLAPDERIIEIAKLLSGKEITDAAMSNARELLAN